jgi:uncharacterized phiE125 gp8 family phage protein
MRYRSLVRTEEPTEALLTLEEVRHHVRVDDDETEMAYLGSLIAVATDYIENRRSEALLDQEWTMTLDSFPGFSRGLKIPRPPLQTITSITYTDTQGATQTLDSSLYRVLATSRPGEVHPVYGTTWPSTLPDAGVVTVVFQAGYETAADVSEGLKQAAKIMVATWFEQREAVITGTSVSRVPRSADALIDLTRTEW